MDETQKNTTDIAVLQNQVTTVMEDIKEIKANTAQHEKNDVECFDKMMDRMQKLIDYIEKEHKEIKSEIADVKAQQKVDKVKLGTLITILASIGSVLLKVALDGLTQIIK